MIRKTSRSGYNWAAGFIVVNSEYKPLEAVLLYKPGQEIETIENPQEVLHLRDINYEVMEEEYRWIIKLYRGLKIDVYLIDPTKESDGDDKYLFNLMYARDLLFMTPGGAIISRMAHDVRRDEVKYAAEALRNNNIPIKTTIKPGKTFEGADALWVNDRLVLIGTGNRTNIEGFLQIQKELEKQGVNCISVPVPRGIQHLLGVLQIIDSDLALARVDLVDREIIDILKQNKIKIVDIHETQEVRNKQAMNIVTTAPCEIIMPSGCLETKEIYRRHGIKIAGEVEISQLINGGGGLACATAIIARAA